MFVDASALCAILLDEPDSDALAAKLSQAPYRLTSAVAIFETVRALIRVVEMDVSAARAVVARFLDVAQINTIDIGDAEREAALDAMDRFGKGRHPAKLNMGDCFAYACARTHAAPLLFKGDDFGLTDIELA
jgi:ribonuclease VapC